MTLLALIIVVATSQFWISIGSFVAFILSLLFAWVPDKARVPVVSLLGGITGPILSVFSAYLISRWLIGMQSITLSFLIASIVPLILPVRNDILKARQLSDLSADMSPLVKEWASPTTSAYWIQPLGAVIGVFIVLVYLFN